MNDMPIFKPCPFCGRKPRIHKSWYTQHQKYCYGLTCCIVNLNSSIWNFWTLDGLAKLWNKRVDTTQADTTQAVSQILIPVSEANNE
jgi:hypothetical protein